MATTVLGRATCLLMNSQLFALVKSMYPYFQWPFQDPIHWRYLPYIRPM